ncbi:MAG TPA: nuclear transport factor 2 family protein [Solirubrobacteraceae bacterium]|nr:nuclear transport factor 2 family protein [Solirubrobacteraceae bacterium]
MDLLERTNQLLIAYQGSDIPALQQLVAPDVRIRPLSTTTLEPGPAYDGAEGIEQWVRDLERSDRDFQPAVTGIEPHGRKVLVLGCVYAASAGGPLERTEAAWVFGFGEDDRLASMQAYRDHEEARRDALTP